MIHVTILEAQKQLPDLLGKALSGENVQIEADNGRIVRLVVEPTPSAKQPRRAGSCKGIIEIADDFDEPLEELREYWE